MGTLLGKIMRSRHCRLFRPKAQHRDDTQWESREEQGVNAFRDVRRGIFGVSGCVPCAPGAAVPVQGSNETTDSRPLSDRGLCSNTGGWTGQAQLQLVAVRALFDDRVCQASN